METKTIAWTTGSGNITLTYTGQGNGSISVSSSENDLFEDREQSFGIVTTAGSPEKALSILVRQKGKSYPVGEVFNFAYTGSVQQITLPKGKYKLQCWGAQGGTSYGSSNGAGSKGGYSEGVLTLTEKTTLYVFVGGQGSRGSSSSLVNGGWNGGGASVGFSSYSSGSTYGSSYPACGGGATDISTVTSSMSYSSGRTNRSSASLLARCIVAGGGAGGSYRKTETTTTSTSWKMLKTVTLSSKWASGGYYRPYVDLTDLSDFEGGNKYKYEVNYTTNLYQLNVSQYDSSNAYITNSLMANGGTVTFSAKTARMNIEAFYTTEHSNTVTVTIYKEESTTSTSTSSGYSNKSQQGGGTSGKGQYPGTQSSAGTNGGFGYGGNMDVVNYAYCSGGAGGGWYGGGVGYSDVTTACVNYAGGGSGFVNTSENASYRPSGYTGLQLDSGTTKDGSTSFESVSGGTETGHSGNGYARITVIE